MVVDADELGGKGVTSNCSDCGEYDAAEEDEKVMQSCDRDEGVLHNEEKVLIEFNDTIAAVGGEMSHCKVSVSPGDGSVGKVKSAEAERKGHDAMSVAGKVGRVAPDGT